MIITKTYSELPFCEKEILRYAGCTEADENILALLTECLNEARQKLIYKVCYRELAIIINHDTCDFKAFQLTSKDLALRLKNGNKAIVFAATVGVGIDRLVQKYSRLFPSKALLFQAIGAQRIEALCDAFCKDIAEEYAVGLTPRFSPGYGDLPLESQREIFKCLDCERQIGLTLNSSLLMSPSKSVTAFVGLGETEKTISNKCSVCNKTDCIFRGV